MFHLALILDIGRNFDHIAFLFFFFPVRRILMDWIGYVVRVYARC